MQDTEQILVPIRHRYISDTLKTHANTKQIHRKYTTDTVKMRKIQLIQYLLQHMRHLVFARISLQPCIGVSGRTCGIRSHPATLFRIVSVLYQLYQY